MLGNQKKWVLKDKNENLIDDNIIYFFVLLNDLDTPEYHIVPSKIVAKTIKDDHQKWLNTPGKNGQQHNNSSIRKFIDNEDIYLNRWDYLE